MTNAGKGKRVRRGTKWGRCHTNGWIVLVVYERPGYYGYTILAPGKLVASALETHVAGTLDEVQARAERLVPEHDCHCQAWKRLHPR